MQIVVAGINENVGHRSLTTIVNLEMYPRLSENTKWFSCLLVLTGLPSWHPVSSVAIRSPHKGLEAVEAQAKFFQDFFSVQLSPYKMEFGHVCEDPNTWEQRYEKKDFKNHRDMGKVRWGDKQGGYGEHYWDLNHAGHVGDHGNDNDDGSYNDKEYNGSYNDKEHNDPYNEPSEHVSSYNDEYDSEKASKSPFDENNRAKRAQPRIRYDKEGEVIYGKKKIKDLYTKQRNEPKRKNHDEVEPETSDESKSDELEEEEEEEEEYKPREEHRPQKQRKIRPKKVTNFKPKEVNYDEDSQNPNSPVQTIPEPTDNQNTKYSDQKIEPLARNANYENIKNNPPQTSYTEQKHTPRNQYVADVANPQETYEQEPAALTQPRNTPYVPYESGAGLRQHYLPQFAPTAARLFLDPATGNVVDRATGQAYVLQPIGLY